MVVKHPAPLRMCQALQVLRCPGDRKKFLKFLPAPIANPERMWYGIDTKYLYTNLVFVYK